MKKITLKIEFELDDKYKFIAQDADGQLYAYIEKPGINEDFENFYPIKNSSEMLLAQGASNPDWKESLREI
jgi:hypothetical protein